MGNEMCCAPVPSDRSNNYNPNARKGGGNEGILGEITAPLTCEQLEEDYMSDDGSGPDLKHYKTAPMSYQTTGDRMDTFGQYPDSEMSQSFKGSVKDYSALRSTNLTAQLNTSYKIDRKKEKEINDGRGPVSIFFNLITGLPIYHLAFS